MILFSIYTLKGQVLHLSNGNGLWQKSGGDERGGSCFFISIKSNYSALLFRHEVYSCCLRKVLSSNFPFGNSSSSDAVRFEQGGRIVTSKKGV